MTREPLTPVWAIETADIWGLPFLDSAETAAEATRVTEVEAMYALTDIYACEHTSGVSVGTTIDVIAEPTRRLILDELRGGEQPVQQLVQRLAMSQPSVSKHLRVLRDAGLVRVRPDGQRRLYSVCSEPLVDLDLWLEPYRQMWRESLDKLEQHLTEPTKPGRKKE